jgi:hypothetical protein
VWYGICKVVVVNVLQVCIQAAGSYPTCPYLFVLLPEYWRKPSKMGLVLHRKDHFDRVLTLLLPDLSVQTSASAPIRGLQSNADTLGWSDPSFTRRSVNLQSSSKPCVANNLPTVTLCLCACKRCRTFLSFMGGFAPSKIGRRSWHNCSL